MDSRRGITHRTKTALTSLLERRGVIPRSAMLTSPSRIIRTIAHAAFAVRMAESISHTKWLYRSTPNMPDIHLEQRNPCVVDDGAHELCQRLITAYSKASARSQPSRSEPDMWSWILDTRQRDLVAALEQGAPYELATLMSSMFRRDFVIGMAPGPLLSHGQTRLGERLWCVKTLDGVVSLAEALAAVRVENPEQGGTALAFEQGIGRLLEALEHRLEFKLDFPHVGAACGPTFEGRLITPDTPDQIYAAVRLDQAIWLHLDRQAKVAKAPLITEIGGGYGSMCYWFLQRRKAVASYTIIDLPIVNAIQGYFLGRALGGDRVSFFGESSAQVRILPDSALSEVEGPFDALVNKDSLPEMPLGVMMEYLRWGAPRCGLFYSLNQEAGAEFLGKAQGLVHTAVADIGSFELLSRDGAWTRRGYVEEVYLPTQTSSPLPVSGDIDHD